jgi:cephalosporin hydroxylase
MDTWAIADEAVTKWHANQDPVEAAQLLALIAPGDTVLEIGCDRGGMLWAYAQAGAGRVIGVDLPAAGWGSGLACHPHSAELVVGASHRPETRDAIRAKLQADGAADGRGVDLLFIDADHTLDGVRRDWELYGPLVAPGGLVAFHDIFSHVLFPDLQVERLWWELRGSHPDAWEIVNRERPWGHGMGIGVLRCV